MKKGQILSKKAYYPALSFIFVLCLLTACGSHAGTPPEDQTSMIEKAADLPDAEIKIPATLIGDELSDIPILPPDNTDNTAPLQAPDEAQDQDTPTESDPIPDRKDDTAAGDIADTEDIAAEDAVPTGQYGQMDEDNNVTYHLNGDTRTQLLNDLAENIQRSIGTILADKYYYPNITDIKVNSDCTEFTIYLSANTPNLYESSLVLSFYTVGDQYQIYNGIPMEEAKTIVIYVNSETGVELARTDSSSVQ